MLNCLDYHKHRFILAFFVQTGSLAGSAKFEDSGTDVNLTDMSSKLDNALTAKQEAEAKVAGLETKLQQYEQELTQLKEGVSGLSLMLFSDHNPFICCSLSSFVIILCHIALKTYSFFHKCSLSCLVLTAAFVILSGSVILRYTVSVR